MKPTRDQIVPGAIVHGKPDLPSCKVVSVRRELVDVNVLVEGQEIPRHAPLLMEILLRHATSVVPPEAQ